MNKMLLDLPIYEGVVNWELPEFGVGDFSEYNASM